ncbi:hypothetical protein [Thalassoglobus sp.]|uniref:hypothetical protein n=1 Tax=Thalassoglobus sp. TaxID=2795869 RepID=UPI003AA82D3C
MRRHHSFASFIVAVVTLVVLSQRSASAQNPADKTILTIEIMLPQITGSPLQAQQWGRVFEKMGESVQIRQPLPSDKPEIKETKRGTFRVLKVIGELDRKGNLNFPGKSFQMSDAAAIEAWLDQLKVFGAQGAPDGKKFWGLNQEQFEAVVSALSTPVPTEVNGEQLKDILDALPIDKRYPLIVHPDAREKFFKVESATLSQELKGISAGTALAVMLREHGFGFRPQRMPDASIQLSIESLESVKDAWPVGWETDQSVPRNQIVPKLYEFVKTGFEEASLQRVLEAIASQTKTPILIDFRLCQQKEIDVATVNVSYPTKQTAWSLVMESVVRQARLTSKIMLDEAGKPFIWVAPFIPYQQKK